MILHFSEKRFALASDLSGFPLKEEIKRYFLNQGFYIHDVGTLDIEAPVPYYLAGKNVAKLVSDGIYQYGVVLCGSGMGACFSTTKYKKVRCAVCESIRSAKSSRVINNANILALGGNFLATETAIRMVETFINTDFLDGIAEHDKRFLINAVEWIAEQDNKLL